MGRGKDPTSTRGFVNGFYEFDEDEANLRDRLVAADGRHRPLVHVAEWQAGLAREGARDVARGMWAALHRQLCDAGQRFAILGLGD